MEAKVKLSKSMTITQFENGYWYLSELKEFAETIGIPSAKKLRKDELEKAIISFLKSGEIQSPTKRRLSKSGVKDVERGLSLKLPATNYTSNQETKSFIVKEAQKLAPDLRSKSGVWYRLNRWREEQLTQDIPITYADLVNQYIGLHRTKEPFAQIPHGRYINFISDFLAKKKNATREQAIRAWKQLKKMNSPKTYRSWANSHSSKSG